MNHSLSVHTDKKKGILDLGEGPADRLDDTIITVEDKYSANITKSRKNVSLVLNYNAANSFFEANGVKIYHFRAKYSQKTTPTLQSITRTNLC